MKIKTIAEGRKNIERARTDLHRCHWAQNLRDQSRVRNIERKSDQELLQFYLSQWPNLSTDPDHWKKWSDQLDFTTEGIIAYIAAVDAWIATKVGKP